MFFRRRYTKRMEDRDKIDAKKAELNSDDDLANPEWDDVNEIFSIPKLEYDKSTKKFNITLDTGISVKTFFNTVTHEIKFFPADDFIKRD